MFKTRLLSGILLVILALVTILSGGYVLFGTLLVVSLIGMRELYIAMKVHEDSLGMLELAGYVTAVLYYAAAFMDFERYGMMAVLAGLILIMFVYVFCYPKYEAGQVMASFFGVVYVAVMSFFCNAYQRTSRWKVRGMADLYLFLGV
ncbi:phosphatidate cytidylyltransferase [gut metagenome]|uniref:Phosphatidate cytidylyltransferase n=1 Tax=gut metagenome TaxID=749906 RepID=J9GHN3_9ZZZZ